MSNHPPRLAAVLSAAALVVLPVEAAAQVPRVQHFPFGGGSHFEFLIPVQAKGPMAIRATWSPDRTLEAMLFAPGQPRPVARTAGQGALALGYTVESWQAGEQWLLKLVTSDDGSTLRGDLRVVWPAGNRPGSVVSWQNAGPAGIGTRVAIERGIRQLEQLFATASIGAAASSVPAPTDPVARQDMRNMLATMATRLKVLDEIPSAYIRNDIAPVSTEVLRVAPVATAAGGMQLSLVELLCRDHKPWHVDHEADRPYMAVAILPQGNDRADVAHSPVYQFVHAGEAPVASAVGQRLIGSDGFTPVHVAVALFEQEDGDLQRSVERFQHAVELYQMYARLNGGTDKAVPFSWFLSIVTEMRDDVLGTPYLLAIQPDAGASATGATQALDFASHGANYRVVLKVAAVNSR